MGIASWLLVSTAFVTPAAQSEAPSPQAHVSFIQAAPSDDQGQGQGQGGTRVGAQTGTRRDLPAHRVGLGTTITATSNGSVGGSVRYWFTQHLGATFQAQWYRSRQRVATTTGSVRPSAGIVAPSLVYIFGQNDATKPVNLRPYMGAGVNYLNGSASYIRSDGSLIRSAEGFSETVFGGAELWLEQYPNLIISNDISYMRLPTTQGNTVAFSRLNYSVSVHVYLK